jgi:peptidyl-prolyl cis-trans isomerase A (cyclophilin A)
MRIRILTAAVAAILTSPAISQPAEPPVVQNPVQEPVKVALDTSAGRIVIALDTVHAPVTAANFLKYVDGKKFDGESFYRAMPYENGGLVQGGITTDAAKLGPAIAHESTAATGLKHVRGAVSMASEGPGTARADFFILTTDIPGLDASATDPGFAVFGRVVEGMDVVEKILRSPVSATKGNPGMQGQMLDPAIKITKAERVTP